MIQTSIITTFIVKAGFGILGLLPLRILRFLGSFIGYLAWWWPTGYKKKLLRNIAQAFPNYAPDFPRSALKQMFQMYLELPFVWSPMNRGFLEHLNAELDWSLIDKALKAGKGAILVSGHVGSYELLLPLCSLTHSVSVLYKPSKNPWLQKLIEHARFRPNLKMVPANRQGIRELIRSLSIGLPIGLLVDHIPPTGSGVYAPFFNKQAYTTTLPYQLHKATGSPVFVVGLERCAQHGKYQLHILPLDETYQGYDVVEAATLMNAQIERLICLMPTQYLWGYNRYKPPNKKLV